MKKVTIKTDPIQHKLFAELEDLIEQSKKQVVSQVNSILTLTYWQIGKKINTHILQNKRAEYGKQIITTLSSHLIKKYGNSFSSRNIRRMMQFVDIFPDLEIVATLSTQLSWSHFLVLLPIKNKETKMFYAQKASEERWSQRVLARQKIMNVKG